MILARLTTEAVERVLAMREPRAVHHGIDTRVGGAVGSGAIFSGATITSSRIHGARRLGCGLPAAASARER